VRQLRITFRGPSLLTFVVIVAKARAIAVPYTVDREWSSAPRLVPTAQ